MMPVFFLIGMAVYQIYYYALSAAARNRSRASPFFFGLLFVGEVGPILVFGVDYRFVAAPYIGPSLHFGFVDLLLRMLVLFVRSAARWWRRCSFFSAAALLSGGRSSRVSQDRLAPCS